MIKSLANIIGVYDYISDTDKIMGEPLPPVEQEGKELNDSLYNLWIEAHQDKYRQALRTLKNKITHIPYSTFVESLQKTVSDFNTKRNFRCVCLVQPGKSQKWVSEIARTLDFKARTYLCLGEQGADGLEYSLKTMPSKDICYLNHVVIIDDGSFSGNQMANNISRANDILRNKFNIDPTFHILIPYVTQTAQRKINNLSQRGVKIELYYSEIMPVIAEVINKKTLPLLMDVLWPGANAEEKNRKANSTALHWFDHNIPNEMSFPQILTEGIVTESVKAYHIAENASFRFLPEVVPPYRLRTEDPAELIDSDVI